MLIQFAQSKGITVSIKKQSNGAQGVSKGGEIELDPSAGTKTLVHEIAHELMHRNKDRPGDNTIRELEAESVALCGLQSFWIRSKNLSQLCLTPRRDQRSDPLPSRSHPHHRCRNNPIGRAYFYQYQLSCISNLSIYNLQLSTGEASIWFFSRSACASER